MATEQTAPAVRELIKVSISKDEMNASVVLYTPPEGTSPPAVDDVLEALEKAGVVFGIDREAIETILKEKSFNKPFRVAAGLKPERGEQAKFVYHFDTEQKHPPREDENGHIDYRDISFILNTDKGASLATKIPATEGKPGKTVTGKALDGIMGRDCAFKAGDNTEVTDDGLTLKATANGAIQFHGERVSVRDILRISGDVDFSVGNLNSKGSIIVTGDIKAGFEIKTDSDLEVGGNVEDASLIVSGNILVKGGFFGSGQGKMQANGDITLKYAEGQEIVCGGNLTVGGELIDCNVFAADTICIKGSRGRIAGGDVRAGREIRTSVAGSDIGTRTILRVAFDPELARRSEEVREELSQLEDNQKRVKEALYNLYRLQMDGTLPREKQAVLKQLEAFKKDFPDNLEALKKEQLSLEEKMKEFRDACIIIEGTLYSGVIVYFGPVFRDILDNTEGAKLSLEANNIMISALRDT